MANEMIVSFVPSGGPMANAQAPYTALAYMPSCLNTGAGTITAFEYQIVAGGTYYFSDGLYIEQYGSSHIAGLTITVTEPRTDEFWLTGFCEASSSAGPYTDGYTSGIWVAATSPTVDFTISPASLTGLGQYTRTLIATATAGTWDINVSDVSATDWRVNDTEYADVSALINMGFLSGATYVVGMSSRDVHGNMGTVSKTLIGQNINGIMLPALAITETIINPIYLDAFFYIVNTTDVTLSSFEYVTDSSDFTSVVGDIVPWATTSINPQYNNPLDTIGTHYFYATGYGKGTADYSIVSGYIALSAPVAPTIDITIAPNSLTGVGTFTRTVYLAATAGTWTMDESATDWSLDGTETYNASAMGVLIPQPSVVTTHPLIISGYDIYGNMSTKSTSIISQVISAAIIPASNYFHTIAATPAIKVYGRISNTSDIALSSYNWSQDGVEDTRTSLAIAAGSTELSAGTLNVTSIGTKTFVVTCWANALNDIVTAIDRCDFALPTAPIASLSCNTLSADEPFTASFVVATTAGTWAVNSAATDWDFGDGITSAAAGMSVDHSYTPDTSADSWVIRISAYDIYSNLSNIATWHIGDTWSEADRLAEGIRKFTLGYGKGTQGVPLSEL